MEFLTARNTAVFYLSVIFHRGHLDYKEKVATYWPEFAQNGKEDVTVETVLNHQVSDFLFFFFAASFFTVATKLFFNYS